MFRPAFAPPVHLPSGGKVLTPGSSEGGLILPLNIITTPSEILQRGLNERTRPTLQFVVWLHNHKYATCKVLGVKSNAATLQLSSQEGQKPLQKHSTKLWKKSQKIPGQLIGVGSAGPSNPEKVTSSVFTALTFLSLTKSPEGSWLPSGRQVGV